MTMFNQTGQTVGTQVNVGSAMNALELHERLSLASRGVATCTCGLQSTDEVLFREHARLGADGHYAVIPNEWDPAFKAWVAKRGS